MGILDTLRGVLAHLGYRLDLNAFIIVFGLALCRVVTAISLAPFLGGKSTPAQVKIGLSVMICALLYPTLNNADVPAGGVGPVLFVALLVKEGLVGAVIGLLAQFVFYAVQIAGALIDTQRGMDQPAFVSPQLPSNVSVLGNLYFQTALVLFLALNGHLAFIRAIDQSFRKIPLMGFLRFGHGLLPAAEEMIHVSAGLLTSAVQLAAPIMVALFLVDVAFGAIGKVGGRINLHHESQPVKSLAGLGLALLITGLIMGRMGEQFGAMIQQIERLVSALA